MAKDNIQLRLKELPEDPGVYFMKDSKGKIIYIGKAKVLKNRVRSYFQSQKNISHRAALLMRPFIDDVEWIIADSELDALILEANLIAKHKPKFNVRLKDDKHYPYIKVTVNETFPRALLVRKVYKDGAKYFGPYTNVRSVRHVLELIPKLFKIRECDYKLPSSTYIRPCLAYHIKRCDGPCDSLCTPAEYEKLVKELILLLEGKHRVLISTWQKQMEFFSKQMEFEKAAEFRDHIQAVESLGKKTQVDICRAGVDMDLFVVARQEDLAFLVVLEYRDGILIDRKQLSLLAPLEQETHEVLEEFLILYYTEASAIPKSIYIEEIWKGHEVLQLYLSGLHGSPVELIVPKQGSKLKALSLARKNAEMLLVEELARKAKNLGMDQSVTLLKRELKLEQEPRHIIAFDVSHLHGTHTVASMVVFRDGRPSKKEYRRFNIKTVAGIDDYASMAEVVDRRLKRITLEKLSLPDLILIDGGKGQVSAVWKVIQEHGFLDLAVCGIAKRLEEVWFPLEEGSYILSRKSPALKLLQRLRDESHRFAITHQRNRRKENLQGMQPLIQFKGIGPATRSKLIQSFHSFDSLQKATLAEIENCIGVNRAQSLWTQLRSLDA